MMKIQTDFILVQILFTYENGTTKLASLINYDNLAQILDDMVVENVLVAWKEVAK